MFRLYKQRNFNLLINDTFAFMRQCGKSYFAAYFVINGGPLLVLALLTYTIGDTLFGAVVSGATSPGGIDSIEGNLTDNSALLFGAGAAGAIVVLLISVFTYSFPVVYLKLMEDGKTPATKDILRALFARIGSVAMFLLLALLTFVPIMIIASALSFLLAAIVLGIPFAIILFAAISSWITLSFYDYLSNKPNYLQAMKNGFTILFQNFWANIGSTIIFYLIIFVLQGIVSFIPSIIGMGSLLTNPDDFQRGDPSAYSLAALVVILTIILSMLLAYILSNLLLINQGMIYYSGREEKENHSLHADIDLIGNESE